MKQWTNKRPITEIRFNKGQVEHFNQAMGKYVSTGETVEDYLKKIKDHMDQLDQTRKIIDGSN